MGVHCNFSRERQGLSDIASAGARVYNGLLGTEPPAGSRGRAPCQGVRDEAPLKLKVFKYLHT